MSDGKCFKCGRIIYGNYPCGCANSQAVVKPLAKKYPLIEALGLKTFTVERGLGAGGWFVSADDLERVLAEAAKVKLEHGYSFGFALKPHESVRSDFDAIILPTKPIAKPETTKIAELAELAREMQEICEKILHMK